MINMLIIASLNDAGCSGCASFDHVSPLIVNNEPKLDWVGFSAEFVGIIHGCILTLKVPHQCQSLPASCHTQGACRAAKSLTNVWLTAFFLSTGRSRSEPSSGLWLLPWYVPPRR